MSIDFPLSTVYEPLFYDNFSRDKQAFSSFYCLIVTVSPPLPAGVEHLLSQSAMLHTAFRLTLSVCFSMSIALRAATKLGRSWLLLPRDFPHSRVTLWITTTI